VPRLCQLCSMTHSRVCHDLEDRAVFICAMTHLYMTQFIHTWHDSCTWLWNYDGFFVQKWPAKRGHIQRRDPAIHARCDTLQHAANYCNTMQHNATYCNTLQHTDSGKSPTEWQLFQRDLLQCVAVRWNVVQCVYSVTMSQTGERRQRIGLLR